MSPFTITITIHWDFQSLHYPCSFDSIWSPKIVFYQYCWTAGFFFKNCHDVAMLGIMVWFLAIFWDARLPVWPSGNGARLRFNSTEWTWLAQDRVGICHPEMALGMLLCHTMPRCKPCAVFKTSPWQSRPIRGLSWRVSLYFWRQAGYSIIQSKTGSFTKICSRMHVSIITELMRTMTPLLACIHLSLNPQPRVIIFKTMIVAIVFPPRLSWVSALLLVPTPIAHELYVPCWLVFCVAEISTLNVLLYY